MNRTIKERRIGVEKGNCILHRGPHGTWDGWYETAEAYRRGVNASIAPTAVWRITLIGSHPGSDIIGMGAPKRPCVFEVFGVGWGGVLTFMFLACKVMRRSSCVEDTLLMRC